MTLLLKFKGFLGYVVFGALLLVPDVAVCDGL